MAESHTNRVRRRLATTIAATVTACTAGILGSALLHHEVTVLIDGESREVTTTARTVDGVLDTAGVQVGPHDQVLPSPDTTVGDGDTVSITRGRPLELTVDGETRTVWVAATSVDDALEILGMDERGTVVSASRSQRIPAEGLGLTVRLPQDVTVVADGQSRALVSTSETVADLLTKEGFALATTDQVSPALDTYPIDGTTVTVMRIQYRTVVDRTPLPAPSQERSTAALTTGTSRVVDAGAAGVLATTVTETVVDGQVAARQPVSEHVEVAPRPRIVENGTAQRAAAPRATGGLNWSALAQCESGGRPNAVSSTGRYRGLYQFSQAAWSSVGGVGDPAAASATEQTYRAQLLYARSGAGQWPHCGRLL